MKFYVTASYVDLEGFSNGGGMVKDDEKTTTSTLECALCFDTKEDAEKWVEENKEEWTNTSFTVFGEWVYKEIIEDIQNYVDKNDLEGNEKDCQKAYDGLKERDWAKSYTSDGQMNFYDFEECYYKKLFNHYEYEN